MSSENNVIEVRQVSKRFEIYAKPQDRLKQMAFAAASLIGLPSRSWFSEFWALRDVDFAVRRGETVAIIGANGSGKSTLLQILCGTREPTTGEVAVKGKVAALLELGAGFNPEFTGRENIRLSALLYGISEQRLAEQQDAIIAFADIGTFIDQPVKTYSSGMYVRVAFAIAAHVDAEILVVDEALSVGDVRFGQRCMRFLRQFQARGTLLFVSHDLGAVMNLCERAIWLNGGKVMLDGPSKDVVEGYLAAQHALDRADNGERVKVSANRSTRTPVVQMVDHRAEAIANSTRNSLIQVFEFEPDSAATSHGAGGARISHAALRGADHEQQVPTAGAPATIEITVDVQERLSDVIVGFYLKDRLGQQLFGDNTFLTYQEAPLTAEPGERLSVQFTFVMPSFRVGPYSIDVAVATGSQDDHTQRHWITDAVVFEVTSAGSGVQGLVGWPMADIAATKSHGDVQ